MPAWLLEHIKVTVRDIREFCEDYSWRLLIAVAVLLALTYAVPLPGYYNAVPKMRIWLGGLGIMIVVLFILPDTWRRLMAWWDKSKRQMKFDAVYEQLKQLPDDELLLLHLFTIYYRISMPQNTPLMEKLMEKGLVVYSYDQHACAQPGELMLKMVDDNYLYLVCEVLQRRHGSRDNINVKAQYPVIWQIDAHNHYIRHHSQKD